MKGLKVLIIAVCILMSLTFVEGKQQNIHQNANFNSEIKGGHHNIINTDSDQVMQIGVGNNNNIPYGQQKKRYYNDDKGDQTWGILNQVMDIDNQIIGGHHNTIVVDGKQVAVLGKSNSLSGYETKFGNPNLNQEANIANRIIDGHHNVIFVGSLQKAEIDALAPGTSTGDMSQVEDISNQLIGGHHNTIIVGASQTARIGSIVGST